MSEMKTWSPEQKKRTIDVLERVDIVAFAFSPGGVKKGCPLDRLDGRKGISRSMMRLPEIGGCSTKTPMSCSKRTVQAPKSSLVAGR